MDGNDGLSLGHRVAGTDDLFWPVPPLGAFYRIDHDTMRVLRVIDMRRRKERPVPGRVS